MDFNNLKQKITKTAEIAESYFKERLETREKEQNSLQISKSEVKVD